jgi:protein TonB
MLATLCLAWLMKTLIETRSIEDEFEQPPARIVYISNDLEEIDGPIPPNPKQPEPPEESKLEPVKETIELPVEKTGKLEVVPAKQLQKKPEKRIVAQPTARAKFDSTPLFRPKPSYPAKARRRGIEGYVTVRYTITQSGDVRDAEVIGADPPGVFNMAAINAVRSWRYRPQPADRPNMKTRIRFVLRGKR